MNLKDYGNFRNKEFRDYFIGHIVFTHISFKDVMDLSRILNKEEISDNDLISAYLILNNVNGVFVDELFFDYKMLSISKDRKSKFFDIIEAETGIVIDRTMGGMVNYQELLIRDGMTVSKFIKLADIFLDEV